MATCRVFETGFNMIDRRHPARRFCRHDDVMHTVSEELVWLIYLSSCWSAIIVRLETCKVHCSDCIYIDAMTWELYLRPLRANWRLFCCRIRAAQMLYRLVARPTRHRESIILSTIIVCPVCTVVNDFRTEIHRILVATQWRSGVCLWHNSKTKYMVCAFSLRHSCSFVGGALVSTWVHAESQFVFVRPTIYFVGLMADVWNPKMTSIMILRCYNVAGVRVHGLHACMPLYLFTWNSPLVRDCWPLPVSLCVCLYEQLAAGCGATAAYVHILLADRSNFLYL